MATVADYVKSSSIAPDGSTSLAKLGTNLRKAEGLDELLRIDNKVNRGSVKAPDRLGEPATALEDLLQKKQDIQSLVQLTNGGNKVANTSRTAYVNELLRMKNDPLAGLAGFATDQTLSRAYLNKYMQKWLTNNLLSDNARKLLNIGSQVGVRTMGNR